MCTGNSCRSIIAQALIDRYLDGVIAYSCGTAPSGRVNPNAKSILEQNSCWQDGYYSKHIDEVIDIDFDLVITVCNSAKESCPIFPKPTPKLHIPFRDPDGEEFKVFIDTYSEIREVLLPKVKLALSK